MDGVRPSCGEQSWHAREIVGGEIDVEQNAEFADAAHLGLAQRAVLFAPAENTPGRLAPDLADFVAGVTRDAPVDGALAPLAGFRLRVVLRHVRRNAERAQIAGMVLRVITLVGAEGDAVAFRLGLDKRFGGAALGNSLACVTCPPPVPGKLSPAII